MAKFFIPMQPPTITHQMKKVHVVKGKPVFYEPPELLDARQKFLAYLAPHKPKEPMQGAIRLSVMWCFPTKTKKKHGTYKTTKPDTDNLQKLLKDCMEQVGFYKNDAQVASEMVEKFWSNMPGLYINVYEIGSDTDVDL